MEPTAKCCEKSVKECEVLNLGVGSIISVSNNNIIMFAWRIPGTGSLVGCRLWGRTESDMTEAT